MSLSERVGGSVHKQTLLSITCPLAIDRHTGIRPSRHFTSRLTPVHDLRPHPPLPSILLPRTPTTSGCQSRGSAPSRGTDRSQAFASCMAELPHSSCLCRRFRHHSMGTLRPPRQDTKGRTGRRCRARVEISSSRIRQLFPLPWQPCPPGLPQHQDTVSGLESRHVLLLHHGQ